jgi:hypothetical protein
MEAPISEKPTKGLILILAIVSVEGGGNLNAMSAGIRQRFFQLMQMVGELAEMPGMFPTSPGNCLKSSHHPAFWRFQSNGYFIDTHTIDAVQFEHP